MVCDNRLNDDMLVVLALACTKVLEVSREKVGKTRVLLTALVALTELIDVKIADVKIFVGNVDVSNGVPSRAVIDPKKTARRFRACTSPSIVPDVKCQLFSFKSIILDRLLRPNL